MSVPLCQHCHVKNVNRPRGLCHTCYYTPDVLALYPSTSIHAHVGHGVKVGKARRAYPTAALPGTPEKVAVMERRAKRGQAIFHAADVRYSTGELPEPSAA